MPTLKPEGNLKIRTLAVAALIITALLPIITPSHVFAGRMIWSMVDTPSSAFNVIVSPSEISSLIVCQDSRTLYSADTANKKLYSSDDAGASWYDISNHLIKAGATLPAWMLAAAPDNPYFIAAVTTSGATPAHVFVSADSGQNWNNTLCPATGNISSIAISPNYGGYDIAVGTRAAGAGKIFIYKATGVGGTWKEQGFTGDVLSLRFSPNYKSDPSIAVLYTTVSGTYFNAGIRDLNANTTNWTTLYNGMPPEITINGAGTSAKANQVVNGDLELPADYSGQAPSLCRMFASVDAIGGSAGVFRVDGNSVFQLMNAQPGKRISSIAYTGTYASGRLLVGELLGNSTRAEVVTWTTDAPMTCPATCWYRTEKPPTGAATSGYGNAQVAWSPDGSKAYCGTSSAPLNSPSSWPAAYLSGTPLDESALSISRDNGRTWNQLSLIDTQISALSDVAVSADSSTIYIASLNNSGVHLDSIWHTGSQVSGKSWERVLCTPSLTNDIILRMDNAANNQSIFFASRGTDDLRQSQDSGQTWKTLMPGMNIADFSVTSIGNTPYLFALSNSQVRKANVTSLVPQWSQQVANNLMSTHTIFSAPNGMVVVGGNIMDSRVAFSANAGTSFNTTPAFPSAGNIHAIADYRLGNTFIIYAASDAAASNIFACVPGAISWNDMGAPHTGFWGLSQMGTLYGATSFAVDRTLIPETLGPPSIEWSSLDQGLPAGVEFTREPSSLKVSEGVNLWAIDNRPYNYQANIGRLWTYCDCLSPGTRYVAPAPPSKEVLFSPPNLIAPKPDDLIPVFINNNAIADIDFRWQHSTSALTYEIWIAADSDFSKIILQKNVTPQNRTAPSWTLTEKAGLDTGKTYYWKVRVTRAMTGESGTGQWSATLPFTIAQNKEANTAAPVAPATPAVVPESIPGQTSKPPALAGENHTKPFFENVIGGTNSWVLVIMAVLVVALIAIIIGAVKSSRK